MFHALREESRIQVSLGHYTTVAHVPTLRERFLRHRPAAVAGLAQLGGARGELVHFRVGTHSLTFQMGDEHSRCAHSNRAAKPALKSAVGDIFQLVHVPHSQDAVDELSVEALAMGSLLAIQFGQSSLCAALASRLVPRLGSLLDRSVGVVVVGVVGSALAIQMALLATNLFLDRLEFVAEPFQKSLLLSDCGDGRGSEIQTDVALSYLVLGLLVWFAFTDQLDVEAVAALQLAANDTYVLDATVETVDDDGIVVVYDRFQIQTQPFDARFSPPNATRIRFALDGIHLVFALESRASTMTESVLLHRLKGASGEFLNRVDVQVLADPAVVELSSVSVQVVLMKADCTVGLTEGPVTGPGFGGVLLPPSHLFGTLVRFRLAQQIQPLETFAQAGVVHLTSGLQSCPETFLVSGCRLQWQFSYKRWSFCFAHWSS